MRTSRDPTLRLPRGRRAQANRQQRVPMHLRGLFDTISILHRRFFHHGRRKFPTRSAPSTLMGRLSFACAGASLAVTNVSRALERTGQDGPNGTHAIRSSMRKACVLPPAWSRPEAKSPSAPASSEPGCTGPSEAPMPSLLYGAANSADAFRTSGSAERKAEPHDSSLSCRAPQDVICIRCTHGNCERFGYSVPASRFHLC
jgi:hypothetical protein